MTHSSPACSWRAIRNDDVPPGCYTYIPPTSFSPRREFLLEVEFSLSFINDLRANHDPRWTKLDRIEVRFEAPDGQDKGYNRQTVFRRISFLQNSDLRTKFREILHVSHAYLLTCLLGKEACRLEIRKFAGIHPSIHPCLAVVPHHER